MSFLHGSDRADDQPFVSRADGSVSLSRGEVDRRAAAVVERLQAMKEEGILALGSVPAPSFWPALLGTLRAGWKAALVGPSGDRRQRLIRRLNPDLVAGFQADERPPRHLVLNDVFSSIKSIENKKNNRHETKVYSNHGSLLVATSGSTGRPDLVELTDGNLSRHVRAARSRLKLSGEGVWYNPLPFHHLGGCMPFVRSWATGGRVVVPGTEDGWMDGLAGAEATAVSLVPAMLRDGLERAEDSLGALRFVLCGGDRIPPGLVERCLDRGIPLIPSYGLTETTSMVTASPPDETVPEPGFAGRPLDGVDIRIVGSEGDPADRGEEGRITVEGPVVARGCFEGDRFEGRFETSDRGYLDSSGRLYVTGRRSDRIVSGGVTVEARELEDSLLELEGVRDVLVVGLESERWGQRPGGLVVSEDHSGLEQRIERWNDRREAAYRLDTWIEVEELPRTESGKPDRGTARRILQQTERKG